MRRAAAIAFATVLIGVAALVGARVVGLTPGAQPAPATRIYVAVSRSEDETAAREIEVIDTASGERLLFDVAARVGALALAADRRTLYVGTDDGRLLLLDPNRGSRIGEIRTHPATYLVPLGDQVYLVSAPRGGGSVATRVDVPGRREVTGVDLPGVAGRPALQGDALLVPYVTAGVGAAENGLVRLALPSLEVLATRTVVRSVSRNAFGVPLAHALPDGRVAYLAQWDSARGGATLAIGQAEGGDTRSVLLPVTQPVTGRALRGLLEVLSALSSDGDAIHACVGNAELASRYTVRGQTAEQVGAECGAFARADGRLYLAVRGKPRVAVIDPASGKALRDLLLPGIPVAVAPF